MKVINHPIAQSATGKARVITPTQYGDGQDRMGTTPEQVHDTAKKRGYLHPESHKYRKELRGHPVSPNNGEKY